MTERTLSQKAVRKILYLGAWLVALTALVWWLGWL